MNSVRKPALAVRHHVREIATTAAQFFHHSALMGFLDVHAQLFVGFVVFALDVLIDHARPADA